MSKRNKRQSGEVVDQSFRLKKIAPLNDKQADVFDAYYENLNLFLYGTAGTGKSFLALFLALKEVLNPNSPYRKVVVVRSSVASRDQGFLPGTLAEKMSPFQAPYVAMLNDLFGRGDAFEVATKKGFFEVVSTSFLRGITLENCVLICDETQNCNMHELDTVITRVGNTTRVIFCGDLEQGDLVRNKYDVTGLPKFMEILEGMESFEFIDFGPKDIVRSGLVKEYILAKRKVEGIVDEEDE